MIVHILSTGDEILLGDIVDSNSAHLCRAMKDMGFKVERIMAVGDEADKISLAIKEISFSADICLVTGGLGPTSDDVTASACGRAGGIALELDKDAFLSMKAHFVKKGYELSLDNKKQAILPAGSRMMTNHNGTAPGFYIQINQCLFFFMPGVPKEMKMMLEREVKPVLNQKFGVGHKIFIERLTIFGLGESKTGLLLNGFYENFPGIQLGFRADFPIIEVKMVMPDTFQKEEAAKLEIRKAVKDV